MADVIPFATKKQPDDRKPVDSAEALVWTCGNCGCSTFQLLQGGFIRCSYCNTHSTTRAHFAPDGEK